MPNPSLQDLRLPQWGWMIGSRGEIMKNLLIACALLLSLTAQAEDSILSSYELENPDANTLATVSQYFTIDHQHGRSGTQAYEVMVPAEQANLLLAIAPRARLLEADTAAANQRRLRSFPVQGILDGARGYRTLVEVQSWMRAAAFKYPFAKVVEYGKSASGKSLLALRLNTSSEARPALMITAATHGDELITTEVLMSLIDKLLAGYGNDARISAMIDRHDLYFVPVLNVDGFAATRRYDGNADPNRSYPWPGQENAQPTASIAGIIKLFETIKPVGSIDFHAYGEMIMYPWAYTHDPIASNDKTRFHALTQAMASTNGYAYGPIADVIYVAQGSSADYYYWKNGTAGITIEMGQSKIPNPSEIPSYVKALEESTWKFIEAF